ncbi:MAG TPA: YihY/virulence factor BrkB family protein [Labilithrix sp.]|jgi:membrane protein
MKRLVAQLRRVFGDAVTRWDDVEGFRLGAAFSFYATFAIFPLLLLTVTVIGFVVGDADPARASVLDELAAPGTPVRHVLETTLASMQQSRSSRGASAVIGVVTLLYSASGAFVELDSSLNKIWGVRARKSSGGVWQGIRAWLHDRLVGVSIAFAIGVVCVASLVLSAALGAVASHAPHDLGPALGQALDQCAYVALMSLVFAATFRYLPRTRPPFRDVIGGAVFTTALLAILKTLFASYLSRLTSYSAYGVAGGMLAVAMWIWLSTQVIFFGACVTRAACSSGPALGQGRQANEARLET